MWFNAEKCNTIQFPEDRDLDVEFPPPWDFRSHVAEVATTKQTAFGLITACWISVKNCGSPTHSHASSPPPRLESPHWHKSSSCRRCREDFTHLSRDVWTLTATDPLPPHFLPPAHKHTANQRLSLFKPFPFLPPLPFLSTSSPPRSACAIQSPSAPRPCGPQWTGTGMSSSDSSATHPRKQLSFTSAIILHTNVDAQNCQAVSNDSLFWELPADFLRATPCCGFHQVYFFIMGVGKVLELAIRRKEEGKRFWESAQSL